MLPASPLAPPKKDNVRGAAYNLLALEVKWVSVELRGWWMPLGARIVVATISTIAPTVRRMQRREAK